MDIWVFIHRYCWWDASFTLQSTSLVELEGRLYHCNGEAEQVPEILAPAMPVCAAEPGPFQTKRRREEKGGREDQSKISCEDNCDWGTKIVRSQLHPVLCAALPSSACVPCQWCPLSQGLNAHCTPQQERGHHSILMMWSGTQEVAGSVVSQEHQKQRMCFYRLEGDVRMYAPLFSAWLIKFIFRLFSGSIFPCYLISEDTVDCPLLCSCTNGMSSLYFFLSPWKYGLPIIIWGSYSTRSSAHV